jgi:hypothetical protein
MYCVCVRLCVHACPRRTPQQEGHTAHATPEEAEEEAMRMIRVYEEFAVSQVRPCRVTLPCDPCVRSD